jgi:hypothetical protein
MFEMNEFKSNIHTPKVDTYDDVPSDMDVFWRTESQFLPPGKTFEDLTEKEMTKLRNQYKYDYYKPGVYGAITWRSPSSKDHGL